MNRNYKSYWKLLANSKCNNAVHHIQYCALKALSSKSNSKQEIAEALVRKAFTPRAGTDWLKANRAARDAFYTNTIFGYDKSLFFENEHEEQQFKYIIYNIQGTNIASNEPDYVFIFVRQDISKEQQAVQAAHATYCAAAKFQPQEPEKAHFVLVGVRNEYELKLVMQSLEARDCDFVSFIEPDLANSVTALATKTMKEHQKRFLKKYKTLAFD